MSEMEKHRNLSLDSREYRNIGRNITSSVNRDSFTPLTLTLIVTPTRHIYNSRRIIRHGPKNGLSKSSLRSLDLYFAWTHNFDCLIICYDYYYVFYETTSIFQYFWTFPINIRKYQNQSIRSYEKFPKFSVNQTIGSTSPR